MTDLSTQPYKGTRDFYPEDMRVRLWMFENLRKTLACFGYDEYDGPMLEPFELYAAKTSEEIVNEQLYHLIDRGERKLAIRPEMTPTLARMVAQKQNELPKPIRWFSIPNLWRYERPQRGRLREHWQLNVDVFGGGDAAAEDLEILQVASAVLQGFGALDGFEVRLNHRGITDFLFNELLKLRPEQVQPIGRLLDAADKMGASFHSNLEASGLNSSQIEIILQMRDSTPDGQRKLQERFASCPGYIHLTRLLGALDELGLNAQFRFDPSLMRGFLYYTGMVFEVYDLDPQNNRALFGGGRYDNLVGMFGGKPLPGVGFGMGDVTLRHFLEVHGLLPDLKKTGGIYVAHLSDNEWIPASKLCRELRELFSKQGHETAVFSGLEAQKPKKIFPTAERLGARAVIFVGETEVKSGAYAMKDIVQGTQASGSVAELQKTFLEWMRAPRS